MNEQFWFSMLTMVLEALVPLAISVIGYYITKFLKEHNATTEQIEFVNDAYAILARAARRTNQVYVNELKKANGSLNKKQQEEARQLTIELFKGMITEATQLSIEKLYGSVDNWLDLNLESAVNEVKSSQKIGE